jgi:hypothetical protein
VVGEGVLGDGDLEEVAPLGEVGGLEVKGDRDEGFDALDGSGLDPRERVTSQDLENRTREKSDVCIAFMHKKIQRIFTQNI